MRHVSELRLSTMAASFLTLVCETRTQSAAADHLKRDVFRGKRPTNLKMTKNEETDQIRPIAVCTRPWSASTHVPRNPSDVLSEAGRSDARSLSRRQVCSNRNHRTGHHQIPPEIAKPKRGLLPVSPSQPCTRTLGTVAGMGGSSPAQA